MGILIIVFFAKFSLIYILSNPVLPPNIKKEKKSLQKLCVHDTNKSKMQGIVCWGMHVFEG